MKLDQVPPDVLNRITRELAPVDVGSLYMITKALYLERQGVGTCCRGLKRLAASWPEREAPCRPHGDPLPSGCAATADQSCFARWKRGTCSCDDRVGVRQQPSSATSSPSGGDKVDQGNQEVGQGLEGCRDVCHFNHTPGGLPGRSRGAPGMIFCCYSIMTDYNDRWAQLPFKNKVAFFHRNRSQQWQPPVHTTAFQDYLTNPGLTRLGGTAGGIGRSLRQHFHSPSPHAALRRYLNSSSLPTLTKSQMIAARSPVNARALATYLSRARLPRLGGSGAKSAKPLRNRFAYKVKARPISRKQIAKVGHYHTLRSRNSVLRSGKRRLR